MRKGFILMLAMGTLITFCGCVGYYDRDRGEYREHQEYDRDEHRDRDRDHVDRDRGDHDRGDREREH